MKLPTTLILFVTTSLAISFNAISDEAELYDLAPKNSAFIRLISPGSERLSVTIDNKRLTTRKTCSAGNYISLSSGKHTITSKEKKWQYTLKPNMAYSLVIDGNKKTLLERGIFSEKRRALFEVYNLTDKPEISISTTNSKTPVFNRVVSLQRSHRPINPIKIGLSIYSDGEKLSDAEPIVFQRGKSSSLLVCQKDRTILTNWSQN